MRGTIASAVLVTTVIVAALPAFGSGSVEEKGTVTFGEGAGMLNKLGGAATGTGLVTKTFIDGDSKRTEVGDTGVYVNLAEERVCDLNYKKSRATCQTFAEKREQLAAINDVTGGLFGGSRASGQDPQPTVEYEAKFEIQEIGPETVNGHSATHFRWIATVHPKGMTIETGGGGIVTTDLWIGPEIPVVQEILEFDRRYLEAMGLPGGEQAAQVLKSYPALAAAMESFEENADRMEGTPVKTLMVLETVRGTNPPADSGGDSGSPLGKLGFGRKKSNSDGGDTAPDVPVERLRSTTEILSTDDSSGGAAIPAGFKIKG